MPNLMEVMRHEVKAVPHTSPISEAAQQMKIWRVSALLVKHNHDFVGIIRIPTLSEREWPKPRIYRV